MERVNFTPPVLFHIDGETDFGFIVKADEHTEQILCAHYYIL